MYKKNECVAMLLAGGQGSRLYVLTADVAKPAVPFGGKYRIIDFPLSNCVNSGIDTVGVLTQYKPLELNSYIGSGQSWDLDRNTGGVHILPPYMKAKYGEWYKGTANAIYQNISFLDNYAPEYVLILSGDHIYKMNYGKMLDYHKAKSADCTIAAIEVPIEEASRFGILNTNPDGSIYEFEEKPEKPKSRLASMGIYIFTWEKLRAYLEKDEQNPDSENDFGKNILPTMLKDGQKMFSYQFQGYWKDVGTIHSLWEANMDMLSPGTGLDLNDPSWRIYYRNPASPPHYIAPCAKVSHATVTEGCEVYGIVEESVLFNNVTVEEGAQVRYSILMPGVKVGKNARVDFSIIAENSVIGECAQIGSADVIDAQGGKITVLSSGIKISDNTVVAAGEMLDSDR